MEVTFRELGNLPRYSYRGPSTAQGFMCLYNLMQPKVFVDRNP